MANRITRATTYIDQRQRRSKSLSFVYAAIKKYSDDNGDYHAALLAYYGFLSVFPLLLSVLTVVRLVFRGHPDIQQRVSESISQYFPLLGSQPQQNIGSLGKTGLGLVATLAVTILGARGAADALRFALNNMWCVPKNRRGGFPKTILQSVSIMGVGALGFVVTVGVTIFGSRLGGDMATKVIVNGVGLVVFWIMLMFVFRIAIMKRVGLRDVAISSAIAAVLVQILLLFGGLIVAHQLKNLSSLYGAFAAVLGLLFWLYLLAQVIVHAAEIDTVRYFHLYPRSITGKNLTDGDKKAYELYAKTERHQPKTKEDITVNFL